MPLQRRPLPPPSIDRLLFPAKYDYPHFLEADRAPFDVRAAGFSRAKAWWTAEAAHLAYWKSAKIEAALKKAFGNTVAVQSFYWENVEGYVASFNELTVDAFAIVAFRGTEATSLADVLTDIKFAKTKWDHGGRVHDGFFEAFDDAWKAMPWPLPAQSRVYFTGHSLGGAIATLVADKFASGMNAAQYGGVYTFGSPLVGDRTFVDGFNARHAGKSFRTVNDQDGVALVPPPFVGFRHVDEERFVGLSVRDAPVLEALIDHTPSRYSILCWNAMVDDAG